MGPQISGLANLWHAERFPWHTSFTAVSIFFYIFARPAWLLWRICVYTHTHISDCIHTQCELLLLPNKTAVKHFDKNREECKVLTGYLSLGRWTGGVRVNTRHWKKKVLQSSFQTGSSSSPSYFQIFFLIAFLEEAFIRNIKIILWINNTIIICITNNNATINNNYGRLQDLILHFKIRIGTQQKCLENVQTIWVRAFKKICQHCPIWNRTSTTFIWTKKYNSRHTI